MYIKYFTNDTFNKTDFCALCQEYGIFAIPCEGGIFLDRTQFNSLPGGKMPHWLWMNREYINSEYHTRKATAEEIDAL